MNEIAVFGRENIDTIKEKVQKAVLDSIPDYHWNELVEKHLDLFFKETVEGDPLTSGVGKLIHQHIVKICGERIVLAFNSANTDPFVKEGVEAVIKQTMENRDVANIWMTSMMEGLLVNLQYTLSNNLRNSVASMINNMGKI